MEIKPVHPKGNQSWKLIGRPDADNETIILWPHDAKSWLIGKDPGAGKDWRQENGVIEDKMVGWHHWLNGHEFEKTLGDGEGQGNATCCSPRGPKVLQQHWATKQQQHYFHFTQEHVKTYPVERDSKRFLFPFCSMLMVGHVLGSPFTWWTSQSPMQSFKLHNDLNIKSFARNHGKGVI